jgi:hypothetical protein
LHYLIFDLSDGNDGVLTLEAMASTQRAEHPAVMAEIQQVLDRAWTLEPRSHGSAEDGMLWDHDLQVSIEDGGWHAVTLTITGPPPFIDDVMSAFGEP